MTEKVDTGKIISTFSFKISKRESVLSLSERTYHQMFIQFKHVLNMIKNNLQILKKWKREPFKKKNWMNYVNAIQQ